MSLSSHVHFIKYGFDGESLFGNPEPHHFYDFRASAAAYAQLCRTRLEQEYPQADIYIEYRYDEDSGELQPNMLLNDVMDEDGYSLGAEEIQKVEGLCLEVQDEKLWIKQDARERLKEVCRKPTLRIPASVIRWACQNNILSRSIRSDREYWFRQADFAAFQRSLKQYSHFEIVAVAESDEGQFTICGCYSKEIANQQAQSISPQCRALLVQLEADNATALLNRTNSGVVVWLSEEKIQIQVDYFTEIEPWYHEKWSFEGFASTLLGLAHRYGLPDSREITNIYSGRRFTEAISLIFPFESDDKPLCESLENHLKAVNDLIQEARSQAPVPPVWDDNFLTDEDLFCRNYLDLLLRRMKFVDVTYRGKRKQDEFGKDFTFSEEAKLGQLRHYGLQAKDGDLSGGARSAINEIINQLDDAFKIPYIEPSDPGTSRFISEFIIAISGEFTKNAEEKIRYKISEDRRRYVHFWKGEKVRELVTKYFS